MWHCGCLTHAAHFPMPSVVMCFCGLKKQQIQLFDSNFLICINVYSLHKWFPSALLKRVTIHLSISALSILFVVCVICSSRILPILLLSGLTVTSQCLKRLLSSTCSVIKSSSRCIKSKHLTFIHLCFKSNLSNAGVAFVCSATKKTRHLSLSLSLQSMRYRRSLTFMNLGMQVLPTKASL